MKPRLFDGEHLPDRDPAVAIGDAAMKPRLFDGEHVFHPRSRGAHAVPQ